MESKQIGKLEAICLILTVIINEIVLNVPNIIILGTGSSSIINVIYVSILAILFSILLYKLFNNFSGKDILDISHFVGGKFFKIFISLIFLTFFLIISSLALRYLSNSIKLIYFNNSPLVYLLLFFIIPAIIINKIGFKSIAGLNKIFVFIVIISILFLLFSSYKHVSLYRIFPILGHGFNTTFIKGSSNIFAFTGLSYLFLLPPFLKGTDSFKKVTIHSTIITALFFVFSISTLMLTLPVIVNTDEMLSIYLLTRIIEFGNFLERLDAIFIFDWLLALLSFLSINIFFCIQIFKKMTHIKDEKVLSSSIGIFIFSGSLLIRNYAQIKFWGNYVYRYGVIILVFIIGLGILIAGNIKYRNQRRFHEN